LNLNWEKQQRNRFKNIREQDMRITTFLLSICFLFILSTFVIGQDYKDSALSWQKQANDTRGVVAGVAEELGTIGDQGNTTAKGLIDDALKWLGKGDKNISKGDAEMEKQDYEKASFSYNMAWQYYVKAATAGLNAKRILTGK
jgi:hypothetical protein